MWRAHVLLPRQHFWPNLGKHLREIKNGFANNAPILQQIKPATKPFESDFKEGRQIEGFTVEQVVNIPEFQLRAIHLNHEDTGAQYLHLERDDSNNTFSVNLRTTPFNNSGVPHILEHTTLCGSKRYPCRDPFFKMLNRSLATSMNAHTGPDITLYPFATQNEKDFYNLLSVYMDAVFNPQLKESDFRQEGWRLEHEKVDDQNSQIIFKGVVFNEMKGALCENQRILGESILNKLLPSHTYSVISGGDPLHIPELTYEQLKNFHLQYYHPSNARFYSYGNLPLTNHLKYISSMYLRHYGKVDKKYSEITKVPLEKKWTSERKDHIYGKVDNMAADPAKQSTIAMSYLCSDIRNQEETFLLGILSQLLVSGPNSAFYKSLIEPNVGSGFSPVTGYEGQTRDTFFVVGLQGLNPKDFGWVVDTCNDTVDKVIKEGFHQAQIDGILHNIELNTKHQSSNFGLKMLFALSSLWNHDGDVIGALKVNDQVNKFKEKLIQNPRCLQEKVEQYLKQNKHKLILTLTPDEQFEEKKIKQENEILQTKLTSLTPEMLKKIYKDGLELKEEQDQKQDINCLPTLTTGDLKKDVESDNLKFNHSHKVPIQKSLQPTNGVTYLKGILDTSHLSSNLKPYISIFANVATKMGTKLHNYREFDQLVELKTGGLALSLHLGENKDLSNCYEESIMFSSFALDCNVNSLFTLWEEIFNNVKFEDKSRLETLLKSRAADLVNNLPYDGHIYAMGASAALVDPACKRTEEMTGLSHIKWLCNLVQQNQYEETLAKLDSIAKEVFRKNFMRLSVNFSPESENIIDSNVDSFVNSIKGSFEKTFVTVSDQSCGGKVKTGVQYTSELPVSFASRSLPTVPYTNKDYATLRILCRLLSSKYLLPLIREKGGAYGAGARLLPSGVISFFSYRDPKPADTLIAFDSSLKWITKKDFTDQDVEEAKLGTFQTIDAPVTPGAKGSRDFLYGISEDEFREHRLRLMAVTTDDIVRVASQYLDPDLTVCEGRVVLGPYNVDVSSRPGEKWTVEKL